MKNDLFKGFKEFILRGNVIDLAVGVVIGAAFGKVVESLVKNLITPILAILIRKPNFAQLKLQVGSNSIAYGALIDELISFILIAAAVYFFIIIPMNRIMEKVKRGEEPAAPTTKKCDYCINEIHINALKCEFCTANLPTNS